MGTVNPICDPDAERALAGAALIDNTLFITAPIDPGDFHDAGIRALWENGQHLVMNGQSVDAVTVSDAVIRAVGGAAGMGNLILSCPSFTSAASYAKIIKNCAEQRRCITAADWIGKAAYESDQDKRRELIRRARERLQEIEERYDGHTTAPAPITADEILATVWPEPVWCVPGLLTAGLTILGGKPKLGKSFLILQIAQAIATGGVVFGQQVDRAPILYISIEDNANRLKKRMQKQMWPTGASAHFFTGAKFKDEIGYLTDGGGEKLAALIQAHGYKLAVVDPLNRAIPGDPNEVKSMVPALAPLQSMALELDSAVVIVDHHNKLAGTGANADAVSDLSGSMSGKAGVADALWGLYRERGKALATLAITGRDVEEKSLQLRMDWNTACWQLEGEDNTIELTTRRREILDALEKHGAATLKDLCDRIGQPKSNTHNRLSDLASAGLVVRYEDQDEILYKLAL